jgi:hypothetical protein
MARYVHEVYNFLLELLVLLPPLTISSGLQMD